MAKSKNKPPTFEEFKREIMTIFMDGDPKAAWERCCYYIENEHTYDGKPLTWDLLLKKYREHIDKWNWQYGQKEREGKYFTESMRKERRNFHDFIGERMYEWEFQIPKGSPARDNYLFGPLRISALVAKRERFHELLKVVDYGEQESRSAGNKKAVSRKDS